MIAPSSEPSSGMEFWKILSYTKRAGPSRDVRVSADFRQNLMTMRRHEVSSFHDKLVSLVTRVV